MKRKVMDRIALSALATATLRPYTDFQASVLKETGAEDPFELSMEAVGFSEREHPLVAPSCVWDLAFIFGLELGAQIAADPGQLPDISDLLERTKRLVSKIEPLEVVTN